MTQDSVPPSMDDWKRVEPAGSSFRRATVYALGSMYDWGNRVAWVAAALSVPFFLYVAVYAAPAAKVISQQHEREAIERETSPSAKSTGCPSGPANTPLCANDLTDIRAKQTQWSAEDMKRTL
jgi:hypothetical protein